MFRIVEKTELDSKTYSVEKRFLFIFWWSVSYSFLDYSSSYKFYKLYSWPHSFDSKELAERSIHTHLTNKKVKTNHRTYIRCFFHNGNKIKDLWAYYDGIYTDTFNDEIHKYDTLSTKDFPDKQALLNHFGDPNAPKKVLPLIENKVVGFVKK